MKSTDRAAHKRFYVYRHNGDGNIMYLCASWVYSPNFHDAWLIAPESAAEYIAKDQKYSPRDDTVWEHYCVGSVEASINPHYFNIVK